MRLIFAWYLAVLVRNLIFVALAKDSLAIDSIHNTEDQKFKGTYSLSESTKNSALGSYEFAPEKNDRQAVKRILITLPDDVQRVSEGKMPASGSAKPRKSILKQVMQALKPRKYVSFRNKLSDIREFEPEISDADLENEKRSARLKMLQQQLTAAEPLAVLPEKPKRAKVMPKWEPLDENSYPVIKKDKTFNIPSEMGHISSSEDIIKLKPKRVSLKQAKFEPQHYQSPVKEKNFVNEKSVQKAGWKTPVKLSGLRWDPVRGDTVDIGKKISI